MKRLILVFLIPGICIFGLEQSVSSAEIELGFSSCCKVPKRGPPGPRGPAGPALSSVYGEIAGGDLQVLTPNVEHEFAIFDVEGESLGTTLSIPDHSITIDAGNGGLYLVSFQCSWSSATNTTDPVEWVFAVLVNGFVASDALQMSTQGTSTTILGETFSSAISSLVRLDPGNEVTVSVVQAQVNIPVTVTLDVGACKLGVLKVAD